MPYEDCEGDYGNWLTIPLDQDCLLDLPQTLNVALLSIPFMPKTEEKSRFPPLPSLDGFNPQNLQSLVLTTGILRHNIGEVCLSHWEGLANPWIPFLDVTSW